MWAKLNELYRAHDLLTAESAFEVFCIEVRSGKVDGLTTTPTQAQLEAIFDDFNQPSWKPEPILLHARTLADIPDDPPSPLLFGMVESGGATLAYAAPGTGKGMTGAFLVTEALKLGMQPLIYDAERHPREWSRRIGGLGGDRSRVAYVEPTDMGRQMAGRPFWDVAPGLNKMREAAGADLVIVDSILPAIATAGEDRLKADPSVPFEYADALAGLGVPSLSFAHPPKGAPEGEPFGSFAWVAAHRLTWLGTRAEGEGHRVRWRVRKSNERAHVPGVLLWFMYGADGRPSSVARFDDTENTKTWLLEALGFSQRSVTDLADEMFGEVENPLPGELDRIKERLGQALRRMRGEGLVEKVGTTGKSVVWMRAVRSPALVQVAPA